MKKRSLFAISLMSMALFACSNDEEVNKVIDQTGEGALVTLKLDVAKPQTKGSPGATNTQVGTTAENAIKDVTVVVDYGTEKKYFKSTDTYEDGYGWNETEKKFSFQAPEGDATFYVYANVNSADPVGTSWATDLVSAGTTVSDYYKDSQFFMSNQDGEGVPQTINADGENEVKVNIERAAAKVTVESKADFTDDTHGGTLRAMSFALGNMVNKFYLLQQTDYTIPTNLTYLPDNDVTTDNAWNSVTLGQSVSGQGAVQATTLTGAYCMENISTDNNQSTTTYAKFKTTFTPGKVLDFEAKTGEGESGLTIKSDLKTVTVAEGQTAPTFYVVLEGDRENVTSNYILKSDLYDKNGIALKTGVELTETAEKDGYTVTGIEGISKISLPYTDGQCYFGPIWFNIDDAGTASPVYRNDWYHLTVTSIKLPGSPTEPGDGGKVPLVPDVNVTVTATVLDWEWEARDIELQ